MIKRLPATLTMKIQIKTLEVQPIPTGKQQFTTCRTTWVKFKKGQETFEHEPHHLGLAATSFTGSELSSFQEATATEVGLVVKDMASKHCQLDPLPTWLIKECAVAITPALARIVICPFSECFVPSDIKVALVKPLLKKTGLDNESLKNYRPVSNLSFISKILENIVSNRIVVEWLKRRCAALCHNALLSGAALPRNRGP